MNNISNLNIKTNINTHIINIIGIKHNTCAGSPRGVGPHAIRTDASLKRRPPRWLPIPISDGWLQFRRQHFQPLLKHWHLGKLLVRALRKACGVLEQKHMFKTTETNTRNAMPDIIIITIY